MMLAHGVRHLPVTCFHELIGLLSDRDIHDGSRSPDGATESHHITVEAVLAGRPYYSVDLDQPLYVVLHAMADRHLGAALVTTHGRLAGIFTANDACRAFADHLDRQFRPGDSQPPDAA